MPALSIILRCILIFWVLCNLSAHAQSPFKKCTTIYGDIHQISDSLTILPGTITVNDGNVSFDFQPDKNEIWFSYDSTGGPFEVCYQTLAIGLHQAKSIRSLDQYDSTRQFSALTYQTPEEAEDNLFKDEKIRKAGTINRGISIGSRQDVFVNSELRLKLEGQIADNLHLEAELNDQNIPYQPEGNTQYLQDFDNVLIKLTGQKYQITAGDLVFHHQQNHFLKYNRNVQGGMLNINLNDSSGNGFRASSGYSITKGKYAINNIEAEDGIQGPYRLRGANQERYIMIIANSEKVFLDGELLERGFEQDYTIDYNQAEITFTTSRIITRFSRISVEFEYTNFDYNRSSTFFQSEWKKNKLTFGFNYWMEKDNPAFYRGRLLSFEERNRLIESDPETDHLMMPGYDSVGYSQQRLLYKRETVIDQDGVEHLVFVYSNHPDSAKYSLTFNEVGSGNGDYVQDQFNALGKTYKWVSPVQGESKGNYAPVIRMMTPRKKQMVALSSRYQLSEHQQLFSEISISTFNQNLFSEESSRVQNGVGWKAGYQIQNQPVSWLNSYRLNSALSYEFTDQQFTFIDRYRPLEFEREWNTIDSLKTDQHLVQVGGTLEKNQDNQISYEMIYNDRGSDQGFRHLLQLKQQYGRFNFKGKLYQLDNQQFNQNYSWRKVGMETRYRTNNLDPGYRFEAEVNDNKFFTENFTGRSANYQQHQFYLQSRDSAQHKFQLNYLLRKDRLDDQILQPMVNSQTLRLDYEVEGELQRLKLDVGYRISDNFNETATNPDRQESVLGSLNWRASFLKGNLSTDLRYAVSNGRELKREYVFFQVPTGEGTHTWRDDNQDGIQDLNEFYLALNSDEKNYVKIFTPTDSYVNAYQNDFNYSIKGKFPHRWRSGWLLPDLLSRLMADASLRYIGKTSGTGLSERLLPWLNPEKDQNILVRRLNWQLKLFFNRDNPVFGFESSISNHSNRQLYTNGFEVQELHNLNLSARVNPVRNWRLQLSLNQQEQGNTSEVVDGQDYLIRKIKLSPEIKLQVLPNLRFASAYGYGNNSNGSSDELEEMATLREFQTEGKLTFAELSFIHSDFRVVRIDFSGNENSALGYQLLEALRPGINYTWSLQIQKKMLQGLYLNLNYEGRKSEYRSLIHFGRFQVQALF